MSALREAVLLQMRLRGFAANTVDAYIHAMVELGSAWGQPWFGVGSALEIKDTMEMQRETPAPDDDKF